MCLLLENLDQLKKSKNWFGASFDTFGWYLFQLTVLIKPDFHCCNSFALFWADKVTTGT